MKEIKWIYANNEDNSSRYLLGTEGERPIFCFGINPSTAEPNAVDNTIRKVTKISEHNNYDSWIMLNVFPVRATVFDDLSKEMTDNENLEHKKNIDFIKNTLSKYGKVDIWLAFGDHIFHRDYLPGCFVDIYNELSDIEINWYAIKTNNSGAPAHPLYQSDDSELIEFDPESFIEIKIENFKKKLERKAKRQAKKNGR